MVSTIERRLAKELDVPVQRIAAAIVLLDEGATVPFIARYRKEITGGQPVKESAGTPDLFA